MSAELVPPNGPQVCCHGCGEAIPVPDEPVTELACLACGWEFFKYKPKPGDPPGVRLEVDKHGKVTFTCLSKAEFAAANKGD